MSHCYDTQPPLLPLVLSAALIAFGVAYSVDAEALDSTSPSAAPSHMTYEPPTLAPSAIVLQAAPVFRAEQGMVKFFFAPSKTQLPTSADSAFQDIVTAIQGGQRIQIAGFHDETGNAQLNTELAKKRAHMIHQHLVRLGAPASAMNIKKPALAAPSSNHAEARRVEVVFVR